MNARIQELAREAGLDLIHGRFMTASQEKFAELIVAECAELCTDPYHCGDAGTGDGFGITAADTRCEKLIKKHFGVEE